MSRIQLDDTAQSSIIKLVEGNPGALRVCLELVAQGAKIDPQSALGGAVNLLSLDTLEIYGSRIWMLYKNVCSEDLTKTIGLLRANQLGYISKTALDTAIDNNGEGLEPESLLKQVQERLPEFGQKQTASLD